jgi:glutamine amidotransferase
LIAIIDYGMGNLLSVRHAVEMIGGRVKICQNPEALNYANRIVLPGVGAFRDCMQNLQERGFIEVLNRVVLIEKKPILGICLGMQAMAVKSFEGGEYSGLGWFEAEVIKLQPADSGLRIPHIGWNSIDYNKESPLFKGLPRNPDLYFVHSYYMKCDNPRYVEATFDYSDIFTAAVRKNNIFATQFHPEKSQDYGLKILENFLNWNP